jgi:hypothetical protein
MPTAELRLRTRLCDDAEKQGFWSSSVNDRFVAGKPDMRLARKDVGQMDFELKILGCSTSTIQSGRSVLSGVTKLQEIEMREMNKHGAPAVGLILLPETDMFVFCNYKFITPAEAIGWGWVNFKRSPATQPCLQFDQLFKIAHEYLRSINA